MRAYGAWTPWEPIDLDIEDNPVLPVVWNDRLFLFWLKIMPENEETGAPDPGEGRLAEIEARKLFGDATPKVDVKVMLSWSERYEGAWQPTRTSDPDEPLLLKENVGAREMRTFRKHVRMASVPWKRGLRIAIGYKSWAGVSFFLHNSFSLPEPRAPKKAPHFMPKRALSTAGDRLTVDYPQEGNTDEVLTNPIGDRAVGPQHPHGAEPWEAPFFYEDARHAFHVTTERRRFTVATWDDIGLIDTARPGLATPDLRIRPPEIPPEVLEPVPDIPGFGVIDPAPIEAFVTEDARLDTGIGTGGTVRYGDAAIGPTGSVLRTRRPTGARG
jgi:hypothetical protein